MRETTGKKPATMFSGDRTGLPFDRYQRCRIVGDALKRLKKDDRPVRILDAGGGEIAHFLPEDDVVATNPTENGGTGALPFDDQAFDYVVSVDALVHVNSEARLEYLSELRRSARRGVLLVAPFDSEAVRGAEQVANEFHRSVYPSESPPLREHAEKGLPDLDAVCGFFEDRGDEVTVLPNGYLPHWLAMTCLSIYGSGLDGDPGDPGGALDSAQAFYNEFLYELDNAEPCYRRLLVALREPANADLDGLISSPRHVERSGRDHALFGALSAVLPLTAEVRRLDGRLARYERDLAQRDEAVERKEARFDARLAEYERRLLEKEGALARKEAQVNDLSGRIASMIALHEENAELVMQNNVLQGQLIQITNSRTWALLAKPRALRRWLLRLRGSSG
jgi:hypothetical protein